MYKTAKTLVMRVVTPMHVGSGSDLGIIDLPIQREKHTSFPKIESSSLKGALRERVESISGHNDLKTHLAFGYDDAHVSDDPKSKEGDFKGKFAGKDKGVYEGQYAGALAFTDARLLLFPIKSLRGVYALATCPIVLSKYADELEMLQSLGNHSNHQTVIDACRDLAKVTLNKAIGTGELNDCICNSPTMKIHTNIVLEEYAFRAKNEASLDILATHLSQYHSTVADRLVVLNDDDFRDFINLSTEVITRTKINNQTGTVDKENGALFTEEFLPTESLMYALVMASPVFQLPNAKKQSDYPFGGNDEAQQVLGFLEEKLEEAKHTVQIGGNATLGKGIVKTFL